MATPGRRRKSYQLQGNRVSNARPAVPEVIVLWNGTFVVLAEKEFHHEGTKFPMKSPGLALVVRILRGLRGLEAGLSFHLR